MFSIVAVLVLLGLGVFLMILKAKNLAASNWNEGSDRAITCVVFTVVAWFIAVLWLSLMSLGSYSFQLQSFSLIKKAKQEAKLYTERRDKLVEVVRVELAKYPEYEKKIIGAIKPEILFQFPTLKSNETITKTVEEIVKLEDAVYKIRASMIETQREIYYRELSPWVIYCTPYEKFFGEPNPLAGVK